MGFKNKAKRPSINSFSIELFYSFFFTTRCREIITNSNFAVKNKLDSVIYSGRRGSSGLKEFVQSTTNCALMLSILYLASISCVSGQQQQTGHQQDRQKNTGQMLTARECSKNAVLKYVMALSPCLSILCGKYLVGNPSMNR